jgi:hypothetical protein
MKRARVAAVAIAGGGAAVLALSTGVGLGSTRGQAAYPVVLVNCGTAQVRPGSFTLACADYGDYLTHLHWVSWGQVAFGTGTEHVNDCHPACYQGKFYSYPILVTVWRAAARPGHKGRLYFSRMTVIRTGRLKNPHLTLPLTQTFDLFPSV